MEALIQMLPYGNYVMVVVGICALLATVIPDTTKVGKFLHVIALNFGKAKNLTAEPAAVAAVNAAQAREAELRNRG